MRLESSVDLATTDARVARAYGVLSRELSGLSTEEGRDAAGAKAPFEDVRDVTGQSTWRTLRELEPGPTQEPLRDALLRWVHELLQARVAWDLVVDEATACHAPDPTLVPWAAKDPDGSVLKTFDEARRALIVAPHVAAADVAFRRLDALARPIAAVRKELRARRFEAARRLGIEHPWALAIATEEAAKSAADLAVFARAVLDATEPLARDVHRDVSRRTGAPLTPSGAMFDAFGRDAAEGWPARLSSRWLEEAFRAVISRPPRVTGLPNPLGGASFLRAAAQWGAAWKVAAAPRTLPFALARDPYPVEAFALGGVLSVAIGGRVFARRKLGMSKRAEDVHARVLARVMLGYVRGLAAELLAAIHDVVRDDELEELTARVFGAPLPKGLAHVWAFGGLAGARRVDVPARLVGAVRAHGFSLRLVDRFDEDWFDNPRAGTHFASIGAGPVWTSGLPDLAAVRALSRAFEEVLG